MGERRIVQAVSPFAASVNGLVHMVGKDDLYYSDDPIVKGREASFRDVEVRSSIGARSRQSVTGSAVETMTAEPGGKRRLGRPPKETRDEKKDEKSEPKPDFVESEV